MMINTEVECNQLRRLLLNYTYEHFQEDTNGWLKSGR